MGDLHVGLAAVDNLEAQDRSGQIWRQCPFKEI
jgi:hypothetical protein